MSEDNTNSLPPVVVEELPIPNILARQIEDASVRINELQERLRSELNDSTREVMNMMGLDNADGWFLDMAGNRFVKLQSMTVEKQPEIAEDCPPPPTEYID